MPSVVGEITKGAVFNDLVNADSVGYDAGVVADWDGSADPGQVEDALDQLAERVTDLEGAGGGGTPGGSNTQVQYNNAGAFGGISGATTNGTFVTLTTPVLGVASATSVNKVALTAPATSATLTLIDGTTLTGPAASGTAMTLGNAETITGVKTFDTTTKLQWRDTGLYINSSVDGQLDIVADTLLQLGATGSLELNDAVNVVVGTTTGTKFGASTSQKLSFWNATPIVQPTTSVSAATFVAGAGTAVNDASTFDGYTLGKVVKALRNAGLLA